MIHKREVIYKYLANIFLITKANQLSALTNQLSVETQMCYSQINLAKTTKRHVQRCPMGNVVALKNCI